ncbi:MAG: hypothetical protein Q4F83_11120 [Eubacteriales bacterium]|nr:hypothetical protein [Eubacteriales bacterium]
MDKEVKEAAEQVAKGRGNRKGNTSKSPIIPTGNINITDKENAAMCEYALDIFHSPAVDLRDPEAVAAAIDGYFKNCIARGLRPGNLGLYATLGLSKQEVSNELRGVTHKLSTSTIDLLKKAKVALSTYREMLGSTGKINPVTLIFWQKNYDGLEDRQTMEIAPAKDMEPGQTPEEIAAQLEQDIPVDADFEEI